VTCAAPSARPSACPRWKADRFVTEPLEHRPTIAGPPIDPQRELEQEPADRLLADPDREQPNMRQARITPPGGSVAAWRSGFPGVGRQLEDVIVPQMAQLFSLEPNWPFPWAKPSDAVTACPEEFA
jgi:hypothetical protein